MRLTAPFPRSATRSGRYGGYDCETALAGHSYIVPRDRDAIDGRGINGTWACHRCGKETVFRNPAVGRARNARP